MDLAFKNKIVADSETIGLLAKKICGYGYFDEYEVADEVSYPIPIKAVEEYLGIGVMFEEKKLKQLRRLADAMYLAAQHLTIDASRLHKAMDEYYQFIIHELNK